MQSIDRDVACLLYGVIIAVKLSNDYDAVLPVAASKK